jgi:hypothetical protein
MQNDPALWPDFLLLENIMRKEYDYEQLSRHGTCRG